LVYFSFLLYGFIINFNLLLSSFLLTFTVYSLDKLTNIKEDSISLPERAGFISKHKKALTYITVCSYIFSLILSFLEKPFAVLVVLFPLCIGLIYSIKISDFRLKDKTGVKNITIAFSWALIGSLLPLAASFSNYIVISFIFYFFFIRVFIGSILFDVRDIEGDSLNGVRTIPVFLGIKQTKKLLLLLNLTLIPWLLFSYFRGYFHRYLLVLMIAIFYGYLHILHFCRERIKPGKLLDLLVDGEFIIIVIAACIFA
jgi:4-hydroxybenzoate polyprenyltransferase